MFHESRYTRPALKNGQFLSTARYPAELRKENALKPRASSPEVAFDSTDRFTSCTCESVRVQETQVIVREVEIRCVRRLIKYADPRRL